MRCSIFFFVFVASVALFSCADVGDRRVPEGACERRGRSRDDAPHYSLSEMGGVSRPRFRNDAKLILRSKVTRMLKERKADVGNQQQEKSATAAFIVKRRIVCVCVCVCVLVGSPRPSCATFAILTSSLPPHFSAPLFGPACVACHPHESRAPGRRRLALLSPAKK